jgi:hypothetical protein
MCRWPAPAAAAHTLSSHLQPACLAQASTAEAASTTTEAVQTTMSVLTAPAPIKNAHMLLYSSKQGIHFNVFIKLMKSHTHLSLTLAEHANTKG